MVHRRGIVYFQEIIGNKRNTEDIELDEENYIFYRFLDVINGAYQNMRKISEQIHTNLRTSLPSIIHCLARSTL